MVIDTSALIAILFNEPERQTFIEKIAGDPDTVMSAASYAETRIVSMRYPEQHEALDRLIAELGIEIVDMTEEQARRASEAYAAFGKGRHPAGLNFGDCFSYALAATLQSGLLFKGSDFSKTDILSAVP